MANTEFIIDVAVPSSSVSSVEAAANSVLRLKNQLETASAATGAAAQAVKAAEAAYKQAESSADRAAKAVEQLGLKADEQRAKLAKLAAGPQGVDGAAYQKATAALAQLTARQAEAAAKSAAMAAAVKAEAAALDRLKGAAAQAEHAEKNISKAHDEAKKAADAAKKAAEAAAGSGKVNEMAEAFGKLGGPLGAVGQKALGSVDGMKKLMSSMGDAGFFAGAAIGIAAIAAAIVAVTVAAAAGVGAILKWAITLADKNKDIDKQMSRLSKNFDSLFSGLKIDGVIASLSKIADLFEETSVTGKAIKVVFESLFQPLVDGLTALQPQIVKTFIQLEIWALKALIAIKPYGSTIVGVAKVLGALGALVIGLVAGAFALMVAGSIAFGAALSYVVKAGLWLTDVILGAAKSAYDFGASISYVVKGGLWLTNVILGAAKSAYAFGASIMGGAGGALTWLSATFGSTIVGVAKVLGVLAAVVIGLVAGAFALIVAGSIAFGVALSYVVKAALWMTDGLFALGKASYDFGASIVNGAGAALTWLSAKFNEVVAFLQSISLAEIGAAMIQGLIKGIMGAGSGVIDSVKNVLGGAVNAAHSLLEINSPSKVFAAIGASTGEGMVKGVDGSSGDVQSSMESMVAPPDGGGVAAGPVSAGSTSTTTNTSSGGVTINIDNVNLQSATDDPQGFADQFRALVSDLLAQTGRAVPA